MPVNFNLLAPSGPQNLYAGFAQGQEAAAQNALVQEKAAQEREMNALRRRQITGQIEGAEEDRAKARRAERVGMYRERILRAPTPEAAREVVKMQYADPEFGSMLSQMGTLEQALAEVPDDPAQFQSYQQREAMGMSEWLKSQMPKTVGNAIYLPSEKRFVTAPSQRLVSVIGPNGVPTMVPADQAAGMMPLTAATAKMAGIGAPAGGVPAQPKAPSGYRWTASGDLEPIPGGPATLGLSAKDIQKREATYPQAQQAVATVSNTMSVIEQTVDRLLNNEEGLDGVTGFIGGRTPGLTDAARQAQADLEQLKNLAFVQGITELRNASKTGAGVGNVSNKEGERFENLKSSLERTQSLKSIKDSLSRLKTQAGFTRQTMQEAFDQTYAYRDQNASAAPAKPSGVNLDQERANAKAAIARGAPADAVRARFKQNTGQEL